MTERRTRSGRVVGVAEGVAAAVRRRQREREPRVVLSDPLGASRLISPSAPGYDELLEVGGRVLEAAGARGGEPRRRPSARSGGASARRGRRGAADEPAA